MATLADAFVRIRPDPSRFGPELKSKTEATAASTGKDVGTTFGKSMAGAIGAAFAAAAVVNFFKGAIAEAQEAAKVTKLTEAVIRSTGGAAKVTADQIGDLAGRLSDLSGVDDEVIQSAGNVLLTFTNVKDELGNGNDVFSQATAAALDLSAALGQDMQSSAVQLGKALNDPIKGVTALQRVGVSFTESQREQIKAMVEAGNVMGAQKLILAELAKEFGGAAAAAASPADKARVAWGNLQEDLGNKLLPTLNEIIHFGIRNQDWLVPLVGSIAAAVVATKALGAAQDFLGLKLDVTAASAGRVAGAFGLAFTALQVAESNGTLRKVGDDLDNLAVKMGLVSQQTADNRNMFDLVWGADGFLSNIIRGGPAAETALHSASDGAHALAAATGDAAAKGKTLLDVWDELNGTMVSADEAVLAARQSINGLKDTFKEGGKSIDGMTLASSENRVELERTAQKAVDAALKYQENGHSAVEAAALLAKFKDEAIKSTGATGKNAAAVKELADQLFRVPKEVTSNVVVNVTSNQLSHVLKQLDRVERGMADGGILRSFARGGIVKSFATGGIERHLAQIVKAGTVRIWGEDETGGEAYIPLALGKRAQSTSVLAEVARMFGFGLAKRDDSAEATSGSGVLAAIGAGFDTGRIAALLETLIDAVGLIASGVGAEINGSVGVMRQLGRAR